MAVSARQLLLSAGIVAAFSGLASAQSPAIGPRVSQFPDVVVSSISSLTNYGTIGSTTAYAMTTVSCNIGYDWAIWYDAGTYQTQHPVIAQQVYRIKDGRFEQIGIGWLKHGWCAADAGNCLNLVNAAEYAANAPDGDSPTVPTVVSASGCDWLGRFTTDTYGAGLNAAQDDLGPRSDINAWTGQFPYPYTISFNQTGNCLFKRVQIEKADLDPAQNAGARYFGECIYIVTDEWPAMRYNNMTHRELTVSSLATGSCNGGSTGYNVNMTGTLRPMVPAIQAFAEHYNGDADPSNDVKLVTVDVPNDGRFYVASTVNNNGDGTYTYEYAVWNYNSHRAARGFSIGKSADATVSTTAFKDVPYHSGERFNGDDWTMATESTQVSWQTAEFATNANANALRWSTLYNFSFTVNSAPASGNGTLELFRPGGAGEPNSVTIVGIDVPAGEPPCPADFNVDELVSSQDIYDFLGQWSLGNPSTDFNGQDGVSVQDIYDYLGAWLEVTSNGGEC